MFHAMERKELVGLTKKVYSSLTAWQTILDREKPLAPLYKARVPA